MTSHKLTYFPINGRGLPVRLLAHVAGLELENDTVAFQDFPEARKSYPYGQLPLLDVTAEDGTTTQIAQTSTILRYIARKAGSSTYPADLVEAAKVDELLQALEEPFAGLGQTSSLGEEEKKAAREAILAGPFARWMPAIEERVASYGGPYACGEQVTLADFSIEMFVRNVESGNLDHIPASVLEPFENILASNKAFRAVPAVAQYLKELADGTRKI